MASQPANSINLNTTTPGLVNFDGTATFGTTGLTQYYTLTGASNKTINAVAPGSTGQVLTSAGASSYPSYQAIPYTQLPWTDETTTFSPAAGNGYFVTGNATATLPASPSQGNTIAFCVDSGSAILTITANTGQYIQVGKAKSASAGTCASNFNGDSITLVYRASDSIWFAAFGAAQGTWTVT
jgi:hypothetical protein